jgi:hypothetical protein
MVKRRYSENSLKVIPTLRAVSANLKLTTGKKKTGSLASLLILCMILCSIIPLNVSASGTDFGVTTVGSTNYPTAKTITSSGVSIDTSQYKFATGSVSFTGSNGQYVRIMDSSSFNFGSSDFTIEMWVRLNSNTVSQDLYTKRVDSTKQISVTLLVSSDSHLQVVANFDSGTGTWDINKKASATVPVNTWTHIALVRSGNTFTMYQNGVNVGAATPTSSTTLSDDGSYPLIGGASNTYSVNGRIDEVRISNVARWTSAFTPSTTRYDYDSHTLVLLHMDGTNGSTSFNDDVITGQAIATKATLSDDDAALFSVYFYAHTTGNYRVAIYSGDSSPSTLLWQSVDTVATVGWNSVPISSGTPSALILSSGTYWLVWQWNSANSGPSYTAGSSGDGQYLFQSYGAFPTTWTGGASSSAQWSIYATYTTAPTVTPEYSWGTIAVILLCFGAFSLFVKYKKA